MSAAGAVIAATVFAAASLATHEARADARDCLLPNDSLASARDTAAYCAEQFVERNGYTELPGTSDREMIAIESWDRGGTLTDAVERRRRTIARGPVIACTTANGFSVVFRAYDPMETKNGHVVVMDSQFGNLRMLAGFTRLDRADPGCTRL
jgi:hypothetical protein